MNASRFIYGDDERLVKWAEERIPDHRFRADAVAIGHERNGRIVAVAVFDTFAPNDCLVGLASDGSWRWSTPEFATVVMAYPFVQCGFSRISCIVSTLNERSLRYTRHFGWREEGLLREAGPHGEDMVLFGMLRRECPYLSAASGGAGIKVRATLYRTTPAHEVQFQH